VSKIDEEKGAAHIHNKNELVENMKVTFGRDSLIKNVSRKC